MLWISEAGSIDIDRAGDAAMAFEGGRVTLSREAMEGRRSTDRATTAGSRPSFGWRGFFYATAVALLANAPSPLLAQAQRADTGSDADDARNDAVLAMPNLSTPAPLENLYATAPGLEQQIPAPRLSGSFFAPLGWDSNPAEVSSGGPTSWETSPLGNVSMSAPIGAPFRLTTTGFGELNRYFSASEVNLDRLGGSARLQYVDPANDQAFSPYVTIAPRWQWASAESGLSETRQDINIGFNKRFNLDGAFQLVPVAADTSAETVWSFGLTAFCQSRARDPRLSSEAVIVIPSASYVISQDWSASVAVELLGRWYERDSAGEASRDWETLPIATLEYLIPASFLGGERVAKLLGRPALDFQGSYLKVWSTVPGVSFGQWEARAGIRMGWRF
jgi:hypothetical protein